MKAVAKTPGSPAVHDEKRKPAQRATFVWQNVHRVRVEGGREQKGSP